MKETVVKAIEEHKIIAILRGISNEKLIPLAEALYSGGIRLLEVTYSANGTVSDEGIAKNIKILSEHFKNKMYIGSGTVLTKEQVNLTKDSGGLFIISPNTDEEVIKESNKCNLVSIPGAMTPSEILNAHKFGADFVKLFPATSLGADYVKAVLAPLSNVKLLAVGGINTDNMKKYLSVGIYGFGVGSNITDKKMIKENDWQGISKLAKKYVDEVSN